MEKEFLPYEASLRMKALGYAEPYFGWYDQSKLKKEYHPLKGSGSQEYMRIKDCTAPTFSQAFTWFRNQYKLLCWIDMTNTSFRANIQNMHNHMSKGEGGFSSYEEAQMHVLNQLLTIVEEKNAINHL